MDVDHPERTRNWMTRRRAETETEPAGPQLVHPAPRFCGGRNRCGTTAGFLCAAVSAALDRRRLDALCLRSDRSVFGRRDAGFGRSGAMHRVLFRHSPASSWCRPRTGWPTPGSVRSGWLWSRDARVFDVVYGRMPRR